MDMRTTDAPALPTKTILMFRIILIFVISGGIAEMVEVLVSPHYSSKALIFELLEHTILLGLLLLFLSKFVTTPLTREIALRRESEERLRQSEAQHRIIVEALPDTVLHVAADGTVLDCRSEHTRLTGFEVGKHVCDTLPPDAVLEFLRHLNGALATGAYQTVDLKLHCGSDICYQVCHFVRLTEHEVLVFIRDITDRRVYQQKLEHLSTHDVLTGLYNRTFYEAELERLATSRRYPVGIIIIDLDGLKATNDTYGHAAGDTMICTAAEVLRKAFRAEDMVARTGGDEFTVILPETGETGLQAAVGRIRYCLEEANGSGDSLAVRLSLGSAIAESKEKLIDAVKAADSRMYQNKAARRVAAVRALPTVMPMPVPVPQEDGP